MLHKKFLLKLLKFIQPEITVNKYLWRKKNLITLLREFIILNLSVV